MASGRGRRLLDLRGGTGEEARRRTAESSSSLRCRSMVDLVLDLELELEYSLLQLMINIFSLLSMI